MKSVVDVVGEYDCSPSKLGEGSSRVLLIGPIVFRVKNRIFSRRFQNVPKKNLFT